MLTCLAPINPGLAFSVKLKYLVFESLQTYLFFWFNLQNMHHTPLAINAILCSPGTFLCLHHQVGQARKCTEKKTTRGMVGAPT